MILSTKITSLFYYSALLFLLSFSAFGYSSVDKEHVFYVTKKDGGHTGHTSWFGTIGERNSSEKKLVAVLKDKYKADSVTIAPVNPGWCGVLYSWKKKNGQTKYGLTTNRTMNDAKKTAQEKREATYGNYDVHEVVCSPKSCTQSGGSDKCKKLDSKAKACSMLVNYRDTKLVKLIDKEFSIIGLMDQNEKMLVALKSELSSMSSTSRIVQELDRSLRVLNLISEAIAGVVPPGADISYAAGTLTGKLVSAFQNYKNIESLYKMIKGDVLEAASSAATAVGKKLHPAGYAIQVAVTNLKLARDILKTTKNDDQWNEAIRTVNRGIIDVEKHIESVRSKIVHSEERLQLINEFKNFTDRSC